jgi:hypothetical protein
MRKLIIAALAATSFFAAVSAANAGWVPGPYGWVYICTVYTPYGCF